MSAGVTLAPSKHLNVGFEVRGLFAATIDLAPGIDSDLNYGQLAVVLGYSF